MVYLVVGWFYAFIKSHSLISILRAKVFSNSRGSPLNPYFSLYGALLVISIGRMRVFRILQ